MANQQDAYVPRYTQERPRGRFARFKVFGVVAVALLATDPLRVCAVDMKVGIKDNSPSPTPALSQRVGETLHGLIGGTFNVTCEPLTNQIVVDPADNSANARLNGYVANYEVPVTHQVLLGSRIHLDSAICDAIGAIP